jgi:Xaa-Pro aminopeptidase
VHVGKATPDERLAYEAVQEAQENGWHAVTAGVSCAEVDHACRSTLEHHKLDGKKLSRYFTHSTGHGVGLEIHEQPRIAKEQKDKLQSGMVVTVEPGVYLPGRFGIRIEDTVSVTSGAATLLTKATKSWIEL